MLFCDADVVGNIASNNLRSGIVRIRSNGLVKWNLASSNGGDGIVSDDSHGSFVANIVNRNGGSGLVIVDQIPDHGPFHTVADNVANANEVLGIDTNLQGVVDGGGNRARRNGDPLQCLRSRV